MNETWITSSGKLEISGTTLRIRVSNDIALYYKQFVDKHFKMFTHFTAHGAHITITNPNIHKNVQRKDIAYARNKFVHIPINFEYNINIKVGGWTKEFKNFYLPVRSEQISHISRILGIKEPPKGYHLTISNTKHGVRPYIWTK
jgi:hypothetical protein